MSLRASDVKRTRAEQVPYTPPGARRAAQPTPSDHHHAEGYTAEAAAAVTPARVSQGNKPSPSQQKTTPGDEAARRRPTGKTKASASMTAVASSSSSGRSSSSSSSKKSLASPESTQAGEPAGAATATEEPRAKEDVPREGKLRPRSRGSSNAGEHPAPPPSDKKNAPRAAACRRKPRQAWAQYVPPSRRGSNGEAPPSSEVAPPSSSSATASGRNNEGLLQNPSADTDTGAAAARDSRGGKLSPSRAVKNHWQEEKKATVTPHHQTSEVAIEKPAATGAADDDKRPVSEDKATGGGATEPGKETATPVPVSDIEGVGITNEKAVSTTPQETPTRPSPASSGGLGTSTESTASPTPDAPSEKLEEEEDVPAPASPSVDSPREGPMGDHSDDERKAVDSNGHNEAPQLPVLKPPSARYIPPGRRKALDTEAAAGRVSNVGGGAAGDGMGPLWASRTPVRVSQRERASDNKESDPAARPSPSRVAGVVSGGMSAYGANISEYSEEMSREQVEACTAVVSNFPAALHPGQRDMMLESFVAKGGLVVWPRPDEALVTFATPALARQAVSGRNNRSTVLIVELLSQTRGERRAAYRRVELARPGRPPTDASSGSRLILGALGIRRPKSTPSGAAATTRRSAASNGGVRGRGAKNVQAPPAESTDSWDM